MRIKQERLLAVPLVLIFLAAVVIGWRQLWCDLRHRSPAVTVPVEVPTEKKPECPHAYHTDPATEEEAMDVFKRNFGGEPPPKNILEHKANAQELIDSLPPVFHYRYPTPGYLWETYDLVPNAVPVMRLPNIAGSKIIAFLGTPCIQWWVMIELQPEVPWAARLRLFGGRLPFNRSGLGGRRR